MTRTSFDPAFNGPADLGDVAPAITVPLTAPAGALELAQVVTIRRDAAGAVAVSERCIRIIDGQALGIDPRDFMAWRRELTGEPS